MGAVPTPGDSQGLRAPGGAIGAPVHCREVGLDDHEGSLPTQAILGYYDQVALKETAFHSPYCYKFSDMK